MRAQNLIALYPQKRSAVVPALHILQEQDGYLSPDGIEHVAELIDLTPAEVRGTASFYDMFHLAPIGRYLVAVCTNIACMFAGAYELLDHIGQRLGVPPGGTTAERSFTLEEVECIALCGNAPCLAVNWRFFGNMTPALWDKLAEDLVAGRLDAEVPPHGTLCRVRRAVGLAATPAGTAPAQTISSTTGPDGGGSASSQPGRRSARQRTASAPGTTVAAKPGTAQPTPAEPRPGSTGSQDVQLATSRTTGAVTSTLDPGGAQEGAEEA